MKKFIALALSALTVLSLTAAFAYTKDLPAVKETMTEEQFLEAKSSLRAAEKQLRQDYRDKKLSLDEYKKNETALDLYELDLDEIELKLAEEKILAILGVKSDANLKKIVEIEKQLIDLEKKEEQLEQDYRDGKLTRDEYRKQLRDIEREEEKLDDKVERYEEKLERSLRKKGSRIEEIDDVFDRD